MSVARIFIAILLLRAAPQDLPYSRGLLQRAVILYLLSGVLALHQTMSASIALASLVLDILVIAGFTYAVLSALELKPRFVQTVFALLGTGVVFHLLVWPLLGQLAVESAPESTKNLLSVIMLLMMSWSILVTAHIYRHALEVQMINAILVALGLFFISMTLSELIIPRT